MTVGVGCLELLLIIWIVVCGGETKNEWENVRFEERQDYSFPFYQIEIICKQIERI